MNDVFARRCAACHQGQQQTMAKGWTPRTSRWRGDALGLRIERPERNAFLLAPLPNSAGGTGKCGQPVFASTSDADYLAVLKTFEPVQELARRTPRMDMPGAVPVAGPSDWGRWPGTGSPDDVAGGAFWHNRGP